MRIVKRVYIFLNDDGRSAAERHREKVHVVVRTLDAKINRHGLVRVQSLKSLALALFIYIYEMYVYVCSARLKLC